MFDTLFTLPLGFWAAVALLIAGAVAANNRIRDGSGLPMLVVLGTVAVWYLGDAFYNDYANNHARVFDSDVLQSAWWQVAWFVAVFLLITPPVHGWLNRRYTHRRSGTLHMFQHGVGDPMIQRQLTRLLQLSAWLWVILVAIAAIRLKGEILYFVFPFLGHKAEAWGRARIGSGFDALLTAAFYFQLLVSAVFGVVASLSNNRRTRTCAIVLCLLSWPYFLFDRTRNTILAVMLPGIVSWGILRVRGSTLRKFAALAGCFVFLNAWMGFVIANRSSMSITTALREKGFDLASSRVHHEGLNMYEELCWINTFMKSGAYHVNWGSRYFAEFVNFIPRPLWPGKPEIGIDYAIARGAGGGESTQAGVNTTLSTGLIGQGVVNFGRVFGPIAAALLLALWVALLARLDLQVQKFGYLPLYGTGLVLTFNLGRDITLITLYPFVFGWLAVLLIEHYRVAPATGRRQETGAAKQQGAPQIPSHHNNGVRWKNVSISGGQKTKNASSGSCIEISRL